MKEPATAKQPTWLLLLQAPRNCETRPHCVSLTTAEQAVVGMFCCGVSLYLVVTDWRFQHHFPDTDISVSVHTSEICMYLYTFQLLAALLNIRAYAQTY